MAGLAGPRWRHRASPRLQGLLPVLECKFVD
uniref:Uncharacterized protein n=1 Tax=Arundo donax TaxID=35708 RepID=A0A0A8YPD1_ARUDO